MSKEKRTTLEQYREAQNLLGSCHDGYCVVRKPKGMCTNGGCGCLSPLDHKRSQYAGYLMSIAQVMAGDLADALDLAAKDRKAHEKEIAVWAENYAALERRLEVEADPDALTIAYLMGAAVGWNDAIGAAAGIGGLGPVERRVILSLKKGADQ